MTPTKFMSKDQYIITIASESSDRMYTTFFSRRRAIFYIAVGIIFFIASAYLVSILMQSGKQNHVIYTLERENSQLKESFSDFTSRTDQLQTELKELKKKNHEMRVAAALPVSELEYGIGGSEESSRAGYDEIQEILTADLNLSNLEREMNYFKHNILDLESKITSRMQQIAHYPSIKPIRGGWISSKFGQRLDPFTGETETHKAIDISTKPGTEVFATAAGVVERVNTRVIKNKGYGKYIIINHGNGYKTLYAHLSQVYIQKGKPLKRWDLIGLTGNTGKSTAPHIHYEVVVNGKQSDPMNFILE